MNIINRINIIIYKNNKHNDNNNNINNKNNSNNRDELFSYVAQCILVVSNMSIHRKMQNHFLKLFLSFYFDLLLFQEQYSCTILNLPTFNCSRSIIETLGKGVKCVYYKDTRMAPLKSLFYLYCQLWKYFLLFPDVLIVNFKQANVCWEAVLIISIRSHTFYSNSIEVHKFAKQKT